MMRGMIVSGAMVVMIGIMSSVNGIMMVLVWLLMMPMTVTVMTRNQLNEIEVRE